MWGRIHMLRKHGELHSPVFRVTPFSLNVKAVLPAKDTILHEMTILTTN